MRLVISREPPRSKTTAHPKPAENRDLSPRVAVSRLLAGDTDDQLRPVFVPTIQVRPPLERNGATAREDVLDGDLFRDARVDGLIILASNKDVIGLFEHHDVTIEDVGHAISFQLRVILFHQHEAFGESSSRDGPQGNNEWRS